MPPIPVAIVSAGVLAFTALALLDRAVTGRHEEPGVSRLVDNGQKVSLSLFDALFSGWIVIVMSILSWYLELHFTQPLLVAYLRTGVQLALLGEILTTILFSESLLVVIIVLNIMLAIAAWEVKARMSHAYNGIFRDAFISMGCGVGVSLVVAITTVGPTPWWDPTYTIPLWGMILGNALTSASLGLGSIMDGFASEGKTDMELLLARGATVWEASRPMISKAVHKGMLPTINSMNVIGLVSLPGMMTGQILGGASPSQACYYQMMIMFMIASSACLTQLISMVLAMSALTDKGHRLRIEKLYSKTKEDRDMLVRLGKSLLQMGEAWGIIPVAFAVDLVLLLVCSIVEATGVAPSVPTAKIRVIALIALAVLAALFCVQFLLGRTRDQRVYPSPHLPTGSFTQPPPPQLAPVDCTARLSAELEAARRKVEDLKQRLADEEGKVSHLESSIKAAKAELKQNGTQEPTESTPLIPREHP